MSVREKYGKEDGPDLSLGLVAILVYALVIRPRLFYPTLEAFGLRTSYSLRYSVGTPYSVHIAHCLTPLAPHQEQDQYKFKQTSIDTSFFV